MKLLVTGSRSLKRVEDVFPCLDQFFSHHRPALLIHGGAVGVDTLAGRFAQLEDIPVQVVRPSTPQGYAERDRRMVDMADCVIAIWDGESKGTLLTKEYARKQGKLVHTWILTTYEKLFRIQN